MASITLIRSREDESAFLQDRNVKTASIHEPAHSQIDEISSDSYLPFNWSLERKWTMTVLALCATFTCNMNSTMITVAHQAINEEFGISDESFPNSFWPITSWALGGGIFAFILLPMMEDFGLRPLFLGTHIIFVCLIIPQALAQNFETLIISRFFTGGCATVLANTAISLVGNVWEGDHARTLPMTLFVTSYMAGTSMGPVFGGLIYEFLSWRWISYVQLILYGLLFPLYYFYFKETRLIVIVRERLRKLGPNDRDEALLLLHTNSSGTIWKRLNLSLRRPLKMLLTEPVIFTFTLWSSFMVGTVYLFTQSTELVYDTQYGWSASQAGYVQAAIAIGECIGLGGAWISYRLYYNSAKRNEENPGVPIPEARLYMSLIGSFCGVAGGMFTYAWTCFPYIHWIWPTIGLAMAGTGVNIVLIAIADYVVDCYTTYAASAMAAVLLVENTTAAFIPLAVPTMYANLGLHWASTLLGAIAIVISFAPLCVVIWGKKIRARSRFMREAILN